MPAFALVSELETYMEQEFTAADALRADQLLRLATGAIQAYTDQHLFAMTGDVVTLYPRCTTVMLPEMPVQAVSALTVDGETVTDYWLNGAGVLSFDLTGSTVETVRTKPYVAVVTYTHGYTTIPEDIKAACLQAAARAYMNPYATRQESTPSYSIIHAETTSGITGGVVLAEGEQRMLDRYRHKNRTT